MTTPYPTGLSDSDILHSVQLLLKTLEAEHKSKQLEYKQLHTYHANRCVVSLKGAMKSLFEVIDLIGKVDSKLIDWYHRSDTIKTVLRLVGLDRRTHTLIEKKTRQLQNKVERAEAKFGQTGIVFDGGLQEAQHVKMGFLEFSTDNVREVNQELSAARDLYVERYEYADALVELYSAEHQGGQLEADLLTASLNDATESCKNAEFVRDAWGIGVVTGVAAVAISSLIFPVLTVPWLAVSIFAGQKLCSSNKEVQILLGQKTFLAFEFSQHEASSQAIKADLATSSRARNVYGQAIARVDGYRQQCNTFIAESQISLDELYKAQTVLENTKEKLHIIMTEIHECHYEVTRRGMATRLREILGELQGVPTKIARSGVIGYDEAAKALTGIESRTDEVLRITALSQRALTN